MRDACGMVLKRQGTSVPAVTGRTVMNLAGKLGFGPGLPVLLERLSARMPQRRIIVLALLCVVAGTPVPSLALFPTAAVAAPDSGATQRFSVAINQRRVEAAMRVLRVSQGDTVEITIASDEEAELHLHGYDILVSLEPGKPAILRFEAKFAGRFAIEAHRFGPPGGRGDARRQREIILLYLEVYPR